MYNIVVRERTMGKKLRVPISTARANLFRLAETLRKAGDDTAVVLEQRGDAEPVVLVREARLAYLEGVATQFEKRDEKPFRLAGSGSTDLDPDTLERVMREIRREWTRGYKSELLERLEKERLERKRKTQRRR